jgi:signal transduction histidine kinase
MKSTSIRWRLSLTYAGIALLTTLLLGLIMMGILTRYYAGQERVYLIKQAQDIGLRYFSWEEKTTDEGRFSESVNLDDFMERLSFYMDAQVRFLDPEGAVIADSGFPRSEMYLKISEELEKEDAWYPKGIAISKIEGNPFINWLLRAEPEELEVKSRGEKGADKTRSQQVVRKAFYDDEGNLLGYVELSHGPAFGRDILASVAWGWGIAALIAVMLSGTAGLWVSRRFSAPLESLARTTTQMAEGELNARTEVEREDEFGQLAEAFNAMAESIETKVTALRRFVADAAHELGSPLTALRTNLELMEEDKVSDALEQVQRMDDLTRNLLLLSKLEAVDAETRFETLDLAEVLQETTESYASRAEQADLTFVQEIKGDALPIQGNEPQLRRLIQNLLDNAIKFTPAGGQVHVQLKKGEAAADLSVADTGMGIPKEDQPRLFSRFHRGSNASRYPGSGLGLAIIKAVADRHQASIMVESAPEGTTVTVRFPLYLST